MEISSAETIVNSTGISPEYESKTISHTINLNEVGLFNNCNNDQTDPSSPVNNEDDQRVSNLLDNRFQLPIVSKIPITNMQNVNHQPQQRNAIARTLANSHPLMSPPDSDSEHSRDQSIGVGVGGFVSVGVNVDAKGYKCQRSPHFSFPDVVPASEHHQVNAKAIGPVAPHNKISMLRSHSLDLLSSESETEVSQYHAAVEANLQSVALISNTMNNGVSSKNMRLMRSRKNGCDDISSLDSISNHSFDDDEDLEHNLASLSPTSSLADGLDDYDDDDVCDEDGSEIFGGRDINKDNINGSFDAVALTARSLQNDRDLTPTGPDPPLTPLPILPQYSAVEERRNSRNWQKITLPDGRMFEIDMRVIEPYKRVLSHGGYLKAGGHNAIVIFCACHLPDRSRADYSYVMDNLFLYVVKTLEQLVTDDYVLIYLHGGCNRRNVPPFPWLKKCYQLLDRRLRKSLKNMYLVHPTFWVKSIVWMARPFVSVKFWRKLVYVKSLEELSKHVSVEKAAIPEKVKQYDAKHT